MIYDLELDGYIERMIDNPKRDRDIEHTKYVIEFCRELGASARLTDEETYKALCAAALHDVRKRNKKGKNIDNHNMVAGDDIRDNKLTTFPDDVADIVEAHCGDFNPKPENGLPSAVVRLADKLDKYRKRYEKAIRKSEELEIKEVDKTCTDNWNEVNEWWNKENPDMREQFEELGRVFEELRVEQRKEILSRWKNK